MSALTVVILIEWLCEVLHLCEAAFLFAQLLTAVTSICTTIYFTLLFFSNHFSDYFFRHAVTVFCSVLLPSVDGQLNHVTMVLTANVIMIIIILRFCCGCPWSP